MFKKWTWHFLVPRVPAISWQGDCPIRQCPASPSDHCHCRQINNRGKKNQRSLGACQKRFTVHHFLDTCVIHVEYEDGSGVWWFLHIFAYPDIYLWHVVAIPTTVDVTRTCMQMYCIRDVHTYKHLVQSCRCDQRVISHRRGLSRSPLENISHQHRMVQRLHKTIYVASTCTFALPAMILRRYLQ